MDELIETTHLITGQLIAMYTNDISPKEEHFLQAGINKAKKLNKLLIKIKEARKV